VSREITRFVFLCPERTKRFETKKENKAAIVSPGLPGKWSIKQHVHSCVLQKQATVPSLKIHQL